MESPMKQSSIDLQPLKVLWPTLGTNKPSSFHATVVRTQNLMRALKTMNSTGDIHAESLAAMGGSTGEISQHQRRGATTLEKATSEETSETSSIVPVLGNRGGNNEVAASSRRLGQRFIILHYSPFKAVWDWVVILLVLYTGIITPYTISFLSDEDQKRTNLNAQAATRQVNRERTSIPVLIIIDVLVDVMFIFDILINFRTTFVLKETNEIVTDPILIAKHYVVDSWRRFAADVLGALPWDILFFGNGSHASMRLANFFKLARLLRLVTFVRNFQKTEYRSAVLFLLMMLFGIAAHWLACIFHFIAILERPNLQGKYSWLDHLADKYKMPYLSNDTLSGPDLKSKYMTALFFAMTSLTSVGFGNVAANTNGEKVFSILAMLAGSFLSAAILGNVTTIIIKLYQGAEELKEMKQNIDDFIKHHRIPKTLAKEMLESFDHEWKNTKGIDMSTVLKTFPECIQADICLHLNRDLLNNCPVFHDASEVTLRALVLLFKSTHVPPGDILIHEGDVLYSIYFVRCGQIEVLHNNDLQVILSQDDILGENPCNTVTPGKSRCMVRGLNYCSLHKIHRDDLLQIFQLFPDFAKTFAERFRVTFDLRQCELNEGKPFNKMDTEMQSLIRQRKPKLQKENRLSVIDGDEARASYRTLRAVSTSFDSTSRRPMSTIVELSPEQAHTSSEDLEFGRREQKNSLASLAQGTVNNVFSTFASMSKKTKANAETYTNELVNSSSLTQGTTENSCTSDKLNTMSKYDSGPVRSMADVDVEIALLQQRFNQLERVVDEKMKMLFDVANSIALANFNHQNARPIRSNESTDRQSFCVIDKLVLTKENKSNCT